MTDILDGVRPVNMTLPVTQNNSTMLTAGVGRGIAPAFTADAIAASVKGRGLIKAGMPGYHIQALFDEIHDIDERIASFGARPVIRASIPPLSDPTAPFGGKTIRGLLRDSGLTQSEAEACGSALDGLKGILPNMRRAILSASGSTRVATFKATRIITQAILDELNKLEADVMASAPEEQAQREYDSHSRQLIATKRQKKEALARFGADAIGNYCIAVEGAATAARMQNLEAQLLAAAKRNKA
ncbi:MULTISPECIES: hypothetical protein [Aeromonas]|uniref:hypothetical protein n=1 Tax=Aeromonas TaxID=642 RepID=UPI0005B4FDFE|nr:MULTISPECIES: hypothetical protein [Aeromonas]TNH76509.1 hypothetical protein CF142_04355 [Aeromonas caviae]